MSSGGRGGKRRGAPPPGPSGAAAKRAHPGGTPQPPPPAATAAAPVAEEEDMMDEDVFLDETILAEDEEALLLLDRDEALASRLSRWKRPALPADLASGCSRNVGTVLSFPSPPPALILCVLGYLRYVQLGYRGRRNWGWIQG